MDSNPVRASARLWSRLKAILAVDLRSLALFRVTLAILLLLDLLRRMANLTAFYTDTGLFPRDQLGGTDGLWRISLHAANGQYLFELVLFSIALVAGAALLIGWRTRLATLISWVLYVSMLNRAPPLVDAGEMLLAALLFWSIFLPLHVFWSVDAAQSDDDMSASGDSLVSWGTAALLLQAVVAFGFVTKMTPFDLVMSRHDYLTAAGMWLQSRRDVVWGIGQVIVPVGLSAAICLFMPFRAIRRIAVAGLALIQVGALMVITQSLLPWAGLVALIPFVDSGIWSVLSRLFLKPTPIWLYYDRQRPISLSTQRLLRTFLILPAAELRAAQDERRTEALLRANQSWIVIDHDQRAYLRWEALVVLFRRSPIFSPLGSLLFRLPLATAGDAAYRLIYRYGGAANRAASRTRSLADVNGNHLIVPICLTVMLAWNLCANGVLPSAWTRILRPPARLLRLDQQWNEAVPSKTSGGNGWFVVPGVLSNQKTVDLLRPNRPLDFSIPPLLSERQGDLDWHHYLDLLRKPNATKSRARYARYLCRHWNRGPGRGARLLSMELVFLLEPAPPIGTGTVEQHILWQQQCPGNAGQVQ